MLTSVSSSRRRLFGALAGIWLILVAALIVGLAAELWLRLERETDRRATERFRASNVFFANSMEFNAANRTLWHRAWRKYKPGARAEVTMGGERFVIQMNSHGYRTHEFAVPKPEGKVRIICIGGSTTVAGRTNEETYPAFLQAKLRARFPRLDLEVLNLGVSGMTTEHWQWRLGEVLSYEPDVVIQYQAANDISWRHLPRYAKDHPLRGWLYRSPLHQRLFPFPVEALDPYLEETFDTLGVIARACRERGISYLASSFAAPDPKRMSGDLRRHLDHNMEYWTRRFPLHSYETWAAIVARHNRLFVDFAHRQHVVHVLPHETLDEPTLFIDVCHFTPEGIERLADVFLPTVAGLVQATPAHALWAGRSSEALPAGRR